MVENVVLVDENDNILGLSEKMEAHQKGQLHRAFSVFVFNQKNQLLLQQRAFSKYHSGGLWTNTCCSHPRINETYLEGANRRLMEEMGMTCELEYAMHFIYRAELDNHLIEHELDHVFVGYTNTFPKINLDEVASYKWMELDLVKIDMTDNPEKYTAWFKIIFDKYYEFLEQ